MNSMLLSIVLYLVLALIAAGAMLLVLRSATGQSVFRARPVMTDNEIEFFRRLCAAWPAGYVFPQVAMSALLKPAGSTSRAHRAAFNSISQKRVDYAIYTADLELHCIVELDDRSHNAQRDARRDAWLASAGIVTLRFSQKDKPNVPELKERLLKKQPTPVAPGTISAQSRASTVTAPAKTRPATVNAPVHGTAKAAATATATASAVSPARPATLSATKPLPTATGAAAARPAGATAPAPKHANAHAHAQAPAPAPNTDELELLEFSPATAPAKR